HTAGLSGGQLQRIAFARILLKPSPVVLLDEPTAKLDIQSGTFVIKAINQLKQESLVIVATHDETLIQQADLSINTGTHGVALS
ncbi:MAG: ATP-binding cassette domain-containing protein, partial [Glaciecola sp.]